MTVERPLAGRRLAAALNLVKAWLLVAALAGAAFGVGWLIGDERTGLFFAFASLLASAASWWVADRALLGMLGARPLAEAEDPLLRSTLDRLSARFAIPAPKLSLVDDGFPRSFVVGRGSRGATIVVSTGLLRSLSRAELECVLAHELAHVRSRDVLTQTLCVLFATSLVELSRIGGFLSRALLYVLAPIGAATVHLMLSPKRELAADEDAATATTDPIGVAAALERLDAASDLVTFEASPTTSPLYPVDPFVQEGLARMFHTHPPLASRLERLRAAASGV